MATDCRFLGSGTETTAVAPALRLLSDDGARRQVEQINLEEFRFERFEMVAAASKEAAEVVCFTVDILGGESTGREVSC